jgi:hypothetical protein
MAESEALQVVIGDHVVQCRNVEDQIRLEPVGGILADGSTEGYGLAELEAMESTLARYDQPEPLRRLRELVAQRRAAKPG